MGIDEAIAVARLIAELGTVVGRKRLQKLVYLLSVSGAREFPQKFTLHYFGPFSRELASHIDFLVAAGIVKEDAPLGEGSYSYSIANEQSELQEMVQELFGQSVPAWAGLAKELNEKNTNRLEASSTIAYLALRGLASENLQNEFSRIKRHLRADFDDSIDLLRHLGIIPNS